MHAPARKGADRVGGVGRRIRTSVRAMKLLAVVATIVAASGLRSAPDLEVK